MWTAAALVAVMALAVLYALIGYRRTWDVPLPIAAATADSTVVARGRYIVYGPGRCAAATCQTKRPALLRGEDVPLTGGEEHTFIGT